jgi:hypothetical protein
VSTSPRYVIDTTGIIRWLNPAAERLVGDARGRQFTSVVATERQRHARELFAKNIQGLRTSWTRKSYWSAGRAIEWGSR